jgi:drug/metabolite transporter (DMT)-like permease
LSWAIDNNCTSKIADVDALTLASIKGIVAGATNTILALLVGAALPNPGLVAASSVVGFLGYGLSLVLFVLALREIGAARTGAYFSTAPFIGAVVGVVALREPLTFALIGAGLLMGFGVYLHLTESHNHPTSEQR